ncbi:MAG TPA: nucleotide disphospho-sugar-binding domain-containing protein, partial [Blastocatellia bacterium]|nr:nucleotide disphospho-sugar-binding domain-containing protein [Blastocatellia bacterium]
IWSKEFETGEIPAEIKEFIIDSKSIVLITHGTSKPDSRSFFQAGIDACLALGSNGIIVTPHDEIALEYATNNIRRYKYLPFASLLPHLGIIIHHGGIGTLNQALTAGIPQLVLSSGIDRPDNGRRLKRLGVGECLPPLRWQTESVAAALLRLMTPEVKERCRQLSVCQTNTEDPAAAACDIIESVIQP